MVERQRFTAEFKREAVRLLDAGVIKILLNFSGVTGSGYSSGLDDLAGAHITAANRGARLKLANLPPVIKDEPLAITSSSPFSTSLTARTRGASRLPERKTFQGFQLVTAPSSAAGRTVGVARNMSGRPQARSRCSVPANQRPA